MVRGDERVAVERMNHISIGQDHQRRINEATIAVEIG